MDREDVEGRWDQWDERGQTKWGNLTRAERNVLGGRWQKRNVKLHPLVDISEEEVNRATAVLPQSPPKLRNGLTREGKGP